LAFILYAYATMHGQTHIKSCFKFYDPAPHGFGLLNFSANHIYLKSVITAR